MVAEAEVRPRYILKLNLAVWPLRVLSKDFQSLQIEYLIVQQRQGALEKRGA